MCLPTTASIKHIEVIVNEKEKMQTKRTEKTREVIDHKQIIAQLILKLENGGRRGNLHDRRDGTES